MGKNSRIWESKIFGSTQSMLHFAIMEFDNMATIPQFLEQLINKKEQYLIGDRFLIESTELEVDEGQILHIFDGELVNLTYGDDNDYELRLVVVNKIDRKNWFEITITMRYSELDKVIWRMDFSRHVIQEPLDEIYIGSSKNDSFKKSGDKLEAKNDINWSPDLDMFLRRGAGYTQFRHFKIKQQYILRRNDFDVGGFPINYFDFGGVPISYADFLISYISNTKHPENCLESIDINLEQQYFANSIQFILNFRLSGGGMPKGGKLFNFDNEQILHILSAKIVNPKNMETTSGDYELEFTLANGPTNGEYLFDVNVQFVNGFKQIVGIKIQKRKIGDILELKCKDQIEPMGKKRKAPNDDGEYDEDGPTCSSKLTKK